MDKYVVVDEEYNIFEPLLLHINSLYTGYRINTIYDYLHKIVKFLNYLKSKNMRYDEVTESTVESYIRYLKGYEEEGTIKLENKLLGNTINGHLTAISGFYKTLDDHESINSVSPFKYVEGFMPSDANRSFLHHATKYKRQTVKRKNKANTIKGNANKTRKRKSRGQINTFRQYISNERDLLIFDILYNTGMRLGELLNLQVFDYSTPGLDGWGTIRIVDREIHEYADTNTARDRQAKTGSREIVVFNEIIERIDSYITNDRPYIEDESFIFVSHKGNKGEPITRQNVEKWFRLISEKSGVKITPHNLRHTHATELTEAGFDPYYIKTRLGHSNVETTAKYQHPSIESQAEALARFRAKGGGVSV